MKPALFATTHQSSELPCAGWKLPQREAMSLRPRHDGVLMLREGLAWVTLGGAGDGTPADSGDYVLRKGQGIVVSAGQLAVIEAWRGHDACLDWRELRGGVRVTGAGAQELGLPA